MRRAILLLLAAVMAAPGVAQEPAARAPAVVLKDLPDLVDGKFKVDPYIRAAAALQALGKDEARKRLKELAQEEENLSREDCVICLCRMLYTAHRGDTFRRPELGGAFFLGRTHYPDWPLEPIEVVDGVPFLITWGYAGGGGGGDSPTSYLRYCLDNCAWGEVKYTPKTAEEKAKALKKLLASKKWKVPLTDGEKEFLARQIK
jgi:hypothetical protein